MVTRQKCIMVWQWLLKLFIFYALASAIFFIFSDFVMFPIPKASYTDAKFPLLKLTTQDGKKISAVYLPNKNAYFTLLFSHGNAEDLGTLMPFLMQLQQTGFAVFAFDYHGYGTSEGAPSEKNTYQDIESAYHHLTHTLQVKPEKIIVFGRSLGTGPVLFLASHVPVAGVILESPMLSAFRLVTQIPFFPFDKYTNYQKISHVHAPILLIHGTEDAVIPFWHGKTLFAKAPAPKQFFPVTHAGHNNVSEVAGEAYFATLIQFSHTLKK